MSITIFEIIHQVSKDTIIFHIQNEKLVTKVNIFNVVPMEPHSETIKKPSFLKNKVTGIL